MDELQGGLAGLAIGPVRFHEHVGSTNDEAARWAVAGAPDLALVIADEQTAGRGRAGRRWFTPPGAALALSLVLRPTPAESAHAALFTALGALAVCQSLEHGFHLPAEIKWPNDVLVERRKLAGVLAEASWEAGRCQSVVLGIGINVSTASVPPTEACDYPATCVEDCLARRGDPQRVDRPVLLRAILEGILEWRPHLGSESLIQAWQGRLAFRQEWVQVVAEGQDGTALAPSREGQVLGLGRDGELLLRDSRGEVIHLQAGEMRLRPTSRLV